MANINQQPEMGSDVIANAAAIDPNQGLSSPVQNESDAAFGGSNTDAANMVANSQVTDVKVTPTVQLGGQGVVATRDAGMAADGKDYWWNELSKEIATDEYMVRTAEQVSASLGARTNIEKNAVGAMENYFKSAYGTAQAVDKSGWSGGYELDAGRQMEYLKATISADMYGQMELQKEGYAAGLAQARFAYNSEQKKLALDYYKTAYTMALETADRTGFFLPPEATDNIAQKRLAEKILADPKAGSGEKNRARGVIASVNTWFTNNKITERGQKTLALLSHEETKRSNKEQERIGRMNAAANLRQAAAAASQAATARASLNLAKQQTNEAKALRQKQDAAENTLYSWIKTKAKDPKAPNLKGWEKLAGTFKGEHIYVSPDGIKVNVPIASTWQKIAEARAKSEKAAKAAAAAQSRINYASNNWK